MKKKHKKKRHYRLHALGGILLVVLLISGLWVLRQSSPLLQVLGVSTENPIQEENTKPGNTDWQLGNPAKHGEIQAYAGQSSVNVGGHIDLYVSTKSKEYLADVYRLGYYGGKGGRLMGAYNNNRGISQGWYTSGGVVQNCPTCITSKKINNNGRIEETDITEANWRSNLRIPIPTTWTSGLYIIKVAEQNSEKYQWEVPVVVRNDAASSDLVYEVSQDTDQAYNSWGGTGLYTNYRNHSQQADAYYASFDRPYEGYGQQDYFYWTYPMVKFLEQQGYNLSYTDNIAVAEGQTNLAKYKGFISGGHNEYWTAAERTALTSAINNGMSAAFFGANNIYWKADLLPDSHGVPDRTLAVFRYAKVDPNAANSALSTERWRDTTINQPEDRILKEMYGSLNGGVNTDFIVKNSNSLVWKGTGVKDGDHIKGILGPEIDTEMHDGSILPTDTITIVGNSPYKDMYGKTWQAEAVLNVLPKGNITFDAGTILWEGGLGSYRIRYQLTHPIPLSYPLRFATKNIINAMIHHGITTPTLTPSVAPSVTPTPTPDSTLNTPVDDNDGSSTDPSAYLTPVPEQ